MNILDRDDLRLVVLDLGVESAFVWAETEA